LIEEPLFAPKQLSRLFENKYLPRLALSQAKAQLISLNVGYVQPDNATAETEIKPVPFLRQNSQGKSPKSIAMVALGESAS
jgi:hypothetical protein